jgi:hypothetical protein
MIRPSQLGPHAYIEAVCPRCNGSRYLTRTYLLETVGDVDLDTIAHRVRCIERPRLDKRGPACGQVGMRLEVVGPPRDTTSIMTREG